MAEPKTNQKSSPHKLGVNRHDPAVKSKRKTHKNFSQSKDVHEDRARIQSKMHHRRK